MALPTRLSSIGLAPLVGYLMAAAVSAGAQQAIVQITVAVEPEAPYLLASADFTITVEAGGGAVSDVTVRIEHDCNAVSDRTELVGNGDDILEPGEQWEYTCHSDGVLHGFVGVTATGIDAVGSPVTASLSLDYGAQTPFDIGITASAAEVSQYDDVNWEVLIGNLGPYGIIDVRVGARVLYDEWRGPISFTPLTGPVEVSGNADELLDPGEVWAYQYTATVSQDSWMQVSISGAPEHAPGTGFGSQVDSDVVAVISAPPATAPVSPEADVLPYSGLEALVLAAVGLLLLSFGLALRRAATKKDAD